MATQLPPGIGTEAEINQANQWMREQPWYQDLLRSWGQTGDVHLNDAQKKQLLNEARVRGLGISDRMEIDPAGNINPKGHKLRNTLIAAGLAAGGIVAAPAIAGAMAGGAAAGGGAAGAGAAGAGVGLGETAATLGLASGAGLGGAVAAPVAAGLGGAAAAGGVGSTLGLDAAGMSGLAGSSALPAVSTVGAVGSLAPALGGSPGLSASVAGGGGNALLNMGKSKAISAAGSGLSKLAGNMANDRGVGAELTLDSQRQFEDQLLKRAQEDRTNRNDALKQSVFSSMLGQWHPADRPMGMPKSPFTGLGAVGDEATKFAGQSALDRLKAGSSLPPLTQPDVVGKYGSSSIWEKLLGAGGTAASIYGGLRG